MMHVHNYGYTSDIRTTLNLSSLADASLSSSVSIQQLVEQTLAPEVREKRCEQCGHETATTTTQVSRVPILIL